MSTIERLNKELKEINTNPPCNCSAGIIEDDIFKWEASIIGPEKTPYQDGVFQLLIDFPQDYPFKSPKIIFKTPIYHCNIHTNGTICLDILKDQWSPALTISKILLSICSLFEDQNPNDPLMPDIANLYINDKQKFNDNARFFTLKYACN